MAAEHLTPGRSQTKSIVLMTALCLAIFLAALDTVVITTALPTIATLFELSDSSYAWVGSSYLLANAASVPIWGKISDIFGRKPTIITANVIFSLGSLLSALSKNLQMLIAGRAVQGLGGGGIVVLVNICVSDLYDIRARGLMLGIVGAIWAISSALGPVIGGALSEKLDWTWCFWINLPIDAVVLVIIVVFLDIRRTKVPLLAGLKAIDWAGTTTVAAATVMLLLGLQLGGIVYPWKSPAVICLLLFSVVTFALFFTTQFKFSKYPLMPFRIFSNLSNLSALAVCFFDAFVFNSVAYFVPLYFQEVLGASPLDSGIWMLALAVPLSIFSASAGWIMQKTGRYLELLRGGLFLMTVGVGLFIDFPSYTSWPRIISFLIIVGIGFGPNFHAPLIALQTRLNPVDIAAGTATFGFIRMLSGAMGVVMGQIVFQREIQMRTGSSSLLQANNTDAKAESFSWTWILYTVASFLGLVTSFGITKNRLTQRDDAPSTTLSSGIESDTEEHGKSEKAARSTESV